LGNHRLIRFDRDLTPFRDIGGHGRLPGLFDQPGFVTVDNDLNILVSDAGNQRICRHDAYLEYVDEISLIDDDDPFMYGHPSGVAPTAYGEVWVCDNDNNRLAIFDNIGRFDRFVGDFGYAGGELAAPQKIVTYDSDKFYVCDGGHGRVVVYDEYGNFEGEIVNQRMVLPRAIAFDKDGLIWLLDGVSSTVLCLDREGREYLVIGPTIAGTTTPLETPSDIAFTLDGRLAIADTGNNRVLVCRIIYPDQ